jgi:molecular chaperone HtpG
MTRTGTLSIHTENIFPIIKKFLYSNQEVFLRELVSNAVDATQKLRALASTGELTGELGDTRIRIFANPEKNTLTISDRGIGMTEAEVEKYINQIAFSSAEEFLSKYKDAGTQIIGHFGLGFYSAFMVADRVEIRTRSWQPDAQAVRWSCDGSTEFELEPAEKAERGTDIILHLSTDAKEFLESWRIREILTKYCRFLPVEIEFENKVINDQKPIWTQKPTELTPDDYRSFYDKLFPFSEAPLFWVHLNVDYPFTLTGVLYFPKLRPDMELQRNKIHLYANQVFITDSVEDVVPDFLSLLHGVIDSPDIPLNVSRSYLQTDSNVRKISNHIAKKVADKLQELFENDRDDYEKKWEYVGVFLKYGMIRDSSFSERVRKICLVETIDGDFYTLDEYLARISDRQTDKNGKRVVLYATDRQAQHTFIEGARKRGYEVLIFDGIIDSHFISYIEHQLERATVVRVDADTLDKLVDKGVERISALNEEETKQIEAIYKDFIRNPLTIVQVQVQDETEPPVTIVRPEHQRRIFEMSQKGMLGDRNLQEMYNVVLNANHPLMKRLLLLPDGSERELLARQSFELALLAQNMLHGEDLSAFIQRNLQLLTT